MRSLTKDMPGREHLLDWHRRYSPLVIHEVNTHLHTPYSFSAFRNMEQLFDMAVDEHIRVLGVNDFYTTGGFASFNQHASDRKVFPLFNIEFMALLRQEQEQGIRINDPNNPGRVYFCGKGLDFPVLEEGNAAQSIRALADASHVQVKKMCLKADRLLKEVDQDLAVDFEYILKKYSMGLVRERHLARAIRLQVFEKYPSDDKRKAVFKSLFGGREARSSLNDHAQLEDEIRSTLLKSGGAAFVREDPTTFLELDAVLTIISDAGGIPCYPVLLDDPAGKMTDYEADWDALHFRLMQRNISCVELIPVRNDFNMIKCFVQFFEEKGFVITFGTEHNTPSVSPLRLSARGGEPLDYALRKTAYEGACVIAAHQYLRSRGEKGYISNNGNDKASYVELGAAVIDQFLHHQTERTD